MTTLLTAKTLRVLLDEVLRRVAAKASLWPDRRLFLIVPESLKADIERRYLEQYAGGLMMAEVLSFRRLGFRLFSEAGGLAVKRLTPSAEALLVGQALTLESGRFEVLADYGNMAGYAVSLAEQLDELARYRIGSDDLRAASDKLLARRSKARLKDLAELTETVQNFARDAGYVDRSDDTERLIRLLKSDEPRLAFLEKTEVFVYGFGDVYPFNEEELRILTALSARVDHLTVALTEGEGECFAVAARSASMLLRALHCRHEIISYEPLQEPEKRLIRAENERILALAVAGYVKELTLSGVRRRDIAVACLGPDDEKRVAAALSQFAVPSFHDNETPLEVTSFSRFVDALLYLTEHRDTLDFLMRYLENPLSGIDKESAERFETICRRMRLTRLSRILKNYPSDPADNMDTSHVLFLLEAVDVFGRQIRAAVGGEEKARLLSAFLQDETDVYDALEERMTLLVERGEAFQATALARSANEWQERLAEAGALLGKGRLAQVRFNRLLREAIRVKSVKNIPVGIDRVRVAPLAQILSYPCDVLILAGVTAETYPLSAAPDSFLSKEERTALAEQMDNGFTAGASDHRLSGLAVDRIVRSLPTKQLIVVMTDEASGTVPATLQDALLWPTIEVSDSKPWLHWGTVEEVSRQLRLALPDASDNGGIKSLKAACENLLPDGLLDEALEERFLRAEAAALSSDRIDAAVDRFPVASVSALQLYNACPFRFFSRHLLRLFPWTDTEPDALLRGTFLHHVLQQTVADLAASLDQAKDGDAALTDWLDAMRTGGLDEAIAKTGNKRELVSLTWEGNDVRYGDRLKEVLESQLQVIALSVKALGQEPVALEWKFPEDDGEALEWEVGGKMHRLSGTIDRVDQTASDGFILVDYKSSPYRFDERNVLLGLDLQLPLYQKVWQETHPAMQPAGFDYIGLLEKNQGRDAAASDEILRRLDQIQKNRVNNPDLALVAEQVAVRTLTELTGGDIGALPASSVTNGLTCRFCEYKAACGLKNGTAKLSDAAVRRAARLLDGKEGGEPDEVH